MEPLVFEVKKDPVGRPAVEVRDPVEEYNIASEEMDKGLYEDAAKRFRSVAELIPKTERAHVAQFNAGLCWEYARQPDEAAKDYRAVLESARNEKEAMKIRFRLVNVLELNKAWTELYENLVVLEAQKLNALDRMSVLTRMGVSILEMGRGDDAEPWLEMAVTFWQENQDLAIIRTGAHIAQAQYALARIYEKRFVEQPLRLPIEQMEKDLLSKWRLLLATQNMCLQVVNRGNVKYGLKAGLKVGLVYELFYDSLMEAEVPPELDDEQKAVYFDELRKKIRPYLFEAFEIYRTNLRVAMRKGHTGEVMQATKAAMDRLRTRIEQDLQEDLRGPPDFTYRARLSKKDHEDKKGRKHKSAIAVILQDRVNFHVLQIRDSEDIAEPRFDDPHEREWYKKLLKNDLEKDAARLILRGTPFIEVRVWRDEVDVNVIAR